jgi:hypothetical protein
LASTIAETSPIPPNTDGLQGYAAGKLLPNNCAGLGETILLESKNQDAPVANQQRWRRVKDDGGHVHNPSVRRKAAAGRLIPLPAEARASRYDGICG